MKETTRQAYSWGILGTGAMATTFAHSIKQSKRGKLIAIASRTQESAEHFGALWNIPHRYAGYEKLLMDKDIQIVYIALPHSMHATWAIKAAEAGKHVVCEKPLGLNYAEAAAIVASAQRNNVYLLEAFMYRFHPQTKQLLELLRKGTIGKVQVIQATFAIKAAREPEGRLLNHALGGGSILDLGCYCTSFTRLVAGAATGRDFAEPINMSEIGYIGSTNVDEYAIAALEFPDGIMAQLFCAVQIHAEMNATIYGSEGFISLPWPFTPVKEGRRKAMMVKRNDALDAEILFTEIENDVYTLEVDAVCEHIDTLQSPEMTHADTLGNMKTLDQWRAAIGMVYAAERE